MSKYLSLATVPQQTVDLAQTGHCDSDFLFVVTLKLLNVLSRTLSAEAITHFSATTQSLYLVHAGRFFFLNFGGQH